MADPAAAYDAVPYDVGAVAGAHPDALAVVGRLWGLEPAAVERCRVLEIGCSTGENLLALALALPGATFHGIDASPGQVNTGRERLAAMGVANVTLECRRVEELGDAGPFDYVICHGVYSWVPAAVREQILARTAALLSPHGLAYISYNTQPGWHLRQQLRNMLLFHLGEEQDAHARIAQARALLEFAGATLRERSDGYGVMLRDEVDALRREPDAYLFHEFLEDTNEPEHFTSFAARAARHGLQYVDSVRPLGEPPHFGAEQRQALLDAGADRIALEQYADFFEGRGFRRSVLCLRGHAIAQQPPASALDGLQLSCAVKRVDGDGNEIAFQFGNGARVRSNDPALVAALDTLGPLWPRSLPFARLCDTVARQVPFGDEDRARLADGMLQCHRSRLLELNTWQPPFTLEPGERPRTTPLALHEARTGSPTATSLRHLPVILHDFDRAVLALLDGTLSRADIAAAVAVRDEAAAVDDVTPPLPAPDAAAAVDEALQRLAGAALLLD